MKFYKIIVKIILITASTAIIFTVLFIGHFYYYRHVVEYWDRKMDDLCSANSGNDVGLKVYERVRAPSYYIRPARSPEPSDIFVPWKLPDLPVQKHPIVIELVELEVLRIENPRVSRYSTRITRVSDEKILAEEIGYMRSGSGISIPDPEETRTCPGPKIASNGTNAIYSEVFVNHPLNEPTEQIQ